MMKITWSYRGWNSLKEIIEYLVQEDIDAARRVRDRIIEKADLLKENPYLGLPYEMNTRRLPLGDYPYAIYYRITQQEIQILQVRHAKRLPPSDLN